MRSSSLDSSPPPAAPGTDLPCFLRALRSALESSWVGWVDTPAAASSSSEEEDSSSSSSSSLSSSTSSSTGLIDVRSQIYLWRG